MSTTPEPSDDEINDLAHDLAERMDGKALPRPAAEGVAAMNRELTRLIQALAEIHDQAAENPGLMQTQFYRQLKRELRDTEMRLQEYQAELDAGQN